MYLYSKAITVAHEKDCIQKEQEEATGIVPLRSIPGWSLSWHLHQESLALSWGGGVNDTQQGFGEPC